MKLDDDNHRKALNFANRCHEKYLNDEFVDEKPSKKRFRESGGGRKYKAPEVRESMFEWFINVRRVLKGGLPIKMFRSKCQQVYNEWLKQQPEPVPEQDHGGMTEKEIHLFFLHDVSIYLSQSFFLYINDVLIV